MMINYSFLRPLKASALKEWYLAPFVKKNQLNVEIYQNATILPLKRFDGDSLLFGRGGVVSENDEYVDLSAVDQRVQYSYKFSDPFFVNEKVVYCGYLVNQWGHFLIEAVARLWYFLKNDDDSIAHYVFFLGVGEKRTITGNYRKFFELLGVWEKISFINQPTRYREIVVPELGYKRTVGYSDQFKDIFFKITNEVILRNKLTEPLEKTSKIFFSRSQIKGIQKREFGLEVIDNYFAKNGYKVLSPEKISLPELILYIKNADEIAMYSGSVHHNILFAADNKKIILIERNVINNEIQVDINRMKNLSVDYIDANIPIYSVNVGQGPFIMAYSKPLEQYTIEKGMCPPDSKYRCGRYLKKIFRGYMRSYDDLYRFQWIMADWCIKYTNTLREGYDDGIRFFGDYLKGNKAYRLSHYLNTNFWKKRLKKVVLHFYSKYHR